MDIPTTVSTSPTLADIPARDVLAVSGRGTPDDPSFTAAVRALFTVRATLGARDDVPLEGSYHQVGDPMRFDLDSPTGWQWRLLVPAPAATSSAAVAAAAAPFGAPVELHTTAAQQVAQLLHHGPYADEGPSLATLYAFVAEQGLVPTGPHIEVYLTDPTSTPPAELRTLLRVPVGS